MRSLLPLACLVFCAHSLSVSAADETEMKKIRQLYKKLDRDRNGRLTLEEFAGIAKESLAPKPDADRMEQEFQVLGASEVGLPSGWR